jgi:hypothetical protein
MKSVLPIVDDDRQSYMFCSNEQFSQPKFQKEYIKPGEGIALRLMQHLVELEEIEGWRKRRQG